MHVIQLGPTLSHTAGFGTTQVKTDVKLDQEHTAGSSKSSVLAGTTSCENRALNQTTDPLSHTHRITCLPPCVLGRQPDSEGMLLLFSSLTCHRFLIKLI